jgi:hypothetical protein
MTLPNFVITIMLQVHCMNWGHQVRILLKKILEYYKTIHLKHIALKFSHYWFILKDLPHWANIHKKSN